MENYKNKYHQLLAEYFQSKPLYLDKPTQKKPNTRKLVEQPWQQTMQGSSFEYIEDTLTDIQFIEAKVKGGLIFQLIEDYQFAFETLPEAKDFNMKKIENDKQIQNYVDDLVRYSDGIVKKLNIIKSITQKRSEEKFKNSETDKAILNRFGRINSYFSFINSSFTELIKYKEVEGFIFQHAYNYNQKSPLEEKIQKLLNHVNNCFLIYKFSNQKVKFNPNPLFEGLIDHKDQIIYSSITPDCKKAIIANKILNLTKFNDIRILKNLENESNTGLICISADARKVVFANDLEKSIQVWDILKGICLKIIKTDEKNLTGLSITPNASIAVTGYEDGNFVIWDLINSIKIARLSGHKIGGVRCAITANGKMVISHSINYMHSLGPFGDNEIRLWDIERLECKEIFAEHNAIVSCIDITPDGTKAISGSIDNEILVWDIKSNSLIHKLKINGGRLKNISISHDGNFAAISNGNNVHLLDIVTGQCLLEFTAHAWWGISNLQLSADARKCITTSADKTLRIWNLTGTLEERPEFEIKDNFSTITFSRNSSLLIAGNKHGSINVYSICDGLLAYILKGKMLSINSLSLSKDGKILVANHIHRSIPGPPDLPINGYFEIWNLDTKIKIQQYFQDSWISNILITYNNDRIIFATNEGISIRFLQSFVCINKLLHHEISGRNNIILNPDGRCLLSGCIGRSSSLLLWDLEAFGLLGDIHPFDKSQIVINYLFTTDGKQVISVSDKCIKLWSLKDFNCTKHINGFSHCRIASLTTDGRKIVASDFNNRYVIDINTEVIETYKGSVQSIKVTWDSKFALSKIDDFTVGIWSLADGQWKSVFYTNDSIDFLSDLTLNMDVVIGKGIQNLIFLSLKNLNLGLPIVSAIKTWYFDKNLQKGSWDNKYHADCPWCGMKFRVSTKIINIINSIELNFRILKENSFYYELPDKVWDNPDLISVCSKCHKPIKYNPFLLNNKDLYSFL